MDTDLFQETSLFINATHIQSPLWMTIAVSDCTQACPDTETRQQDLQISC